MTAVLAAPEGLTQPPIPLTLLRGGEGVAPETNIDVAVPAAAIPHYQAAARAGQEFAARPRYAPSAGRLLSLLQVHGAQTDGNADLDLSVKHVAAEWEAPQRLDPAQKQTFNEHFSHLHTILTAVSPPVRPAFIQSLQRERVSVMDRSQPPVRGDFTLSVLSYVSRLRRFDAAGPNTAEAVLDPLSLTGLQALRADHPPLGW